jgi:DNA-binding XRE family transcriptional regulator
MDKKELCKIRRHLGKTQNQFSQLLGTSLKAMQSFEQGWRNIPIHVERQALLLLAQETSRNEKSKLCWRRESCTQAMRDKCPAWEFQMGNLCWFVNGTICKGSVQESWSEKMKICRNCNVLESLLQAI